MGDHCRPYQVLLDPEQLLEIGNCQNPAHIAVAVGDYDLGIIATGKVPEQQQHAQRRTIQIGGFGHVDLVFHDAAVSTFIGITELLVGAEIEAALDLNRQDTAIRRFLGTDGHTVLST